MTISPLIFTDNVEAVSIVLAFHSFLDNLKSILR